MIRISRIHLCLLQVSDQVIFRCGSCPLGDIVQIVGSLHRSGIFVEQPGDTVVIILTYEAEIPISDYAVIEPILDSKDLKKIKKCLRVNHWPPNHPARAKLWQRLCALHTNERTSIYNETVNEVFGSGELYPYYVTI